MNNSALCIYFPAFLSNFFSLVFLVLFVVLVKVKVKIKCTLVQALRLCTGLRRIGGVEV
jgi:hypothetical protein